MFSLFWKIIRVSKNCERIDNQHEHPPSLNTRYNKATPGFRIIWWRHSSNISVASFINLHRELIFICVPKQKGALREVKQNTISEAFCSCIYNNATRPPSWILKWIENKTIITCYIHVMERTYEMLCNWRCLRQKYCCIYSITSIFRLCTVSFQNFIHKLIK